MDEDTETTASISSDDIEIVEEEYEEKVDGGEEREDDEECAEPLPLADRKRHSTLWFNDGTVVLATPKVIFRVYSGILSLHSPVFRDMFTLPQPPIGSDEDGFDGVPVVHLSDKPSQLAHLLGALHHRDYYCHLRYTFFSKIMAILRLSNKYQINNLREQAISHLSNSYPDKLQGFDSDTHCDLVSNNDHFQMIRIARETGALRLLPFAFYAAAVDNLEPSEVDLSKLVESNVVSTLDLARAYDGRERLRRAIGKEIAKFLYVPSSKDCPSRGRCRRIKTAHLRSVDWRVWNETSDALNVGFSRDMVDSLDDLCDVCTSQLKSSVYEGRRKVWKELPQDFGLENWETLRTRTVL